MAALWLNKLSEINESVPKDNLHVEYLKLLLFALQKNNLTGIFTKYPPEGSLPQYPEMNTATDMIKLLIPTTKSSFPSIYTAIGSGMSEFAAIQEIPNFGLHGYYAISNEPLTLWTQNKTRLLKNNGNRKKISRYKDSLEYKMLKEIDLQQIASKQQMKLKAKLIYDIKDNCIANEINSEEENKRREILGNEIRPCWGTNRYFEKLLDQFPYITTDLEMTTVDTLLHLLKNKKLDEKEIKDNSCVLSVRKKQFKKTFD